MKKWFRLFLLVLISGLMVFTAACKSSPTENTTTTPAPERETIAVETFQTGLEKGTLDSDIFACYFENEYNGEDIQVLANPDTRYRDGYGSNPRTFEGAVFYRSSEGQSFEDILEKMQDAICQIFTQKENEARNGYVMTDYKIYPTEAFPKSSSEPHNLKEVGDEVWRIRTLFIFYKYEGKDFGMTFEQLRDSQGEIWTDENGLTLCTADGSEGAFQMILVKRGDVYLLASPKYFFNEPAAK